MHSYSSQVYALSTRSYLCAAHCNFKHASHREAQAKPLMQHSLTQFSYGRAFHFCKAKEKQNYYVCSMFIFCFFSAQRCAVVDVSNECLTRCNLHFGWSVWLGSVRCAVPIFSFILCVFVCGPRTESKGKTKQDKTQPPNQLHHFKWMQQLVSITFFYELLSVLSSIWSFFILLLRIQFVRS